ncbi:MAG TPA: PBP1A family penicillin-binding protein [Actinomycetota bacterium]|nr:PBP1A family penicillin-binding protein [Actinomycetota bacterium]
MSHLSTRKIPLLIAAVALFLSSCASLTKQFEDLPRLTRRDLRFKLAQSSRILDSQGNIITTLHEAENRTVIPLKQIPKDLQNAVISIEDERFYEHQGVDLRAIFRALLANAASGEIKEGGSTLTQQYVKNVIIAPGEIAEKTLRRKIIEAALARQLEKKLTKKQILERYLNTIYFGEGAYGVQAAALTYFGVPAHSLTLAQSATLAGIIRSPEEYDPYKNKRASKDRRNLVLQKMNELGYVSAGRATKAAKQKIQVRPADTSDEYPAPYFVDYVQRLIKFDPRFSAVGDTLQDRQRRLLQGGLRIYTTVDLDDQAAAETAVRSQLPYADDPSASLVSIDPNTGYIKAMVGGRDYFATPKEDPYAKLNLAVPAEPNIGCTQIPGTKDCVNRAPGSGRQAGSSFKPFALAAAIDQGIPLSKTYKAAPCMDFPGANAGGNWHVCNYEGESFSNEISLLEATVHSVNVVYAQLILEVGPEAVVDLAHDMGINTPLLASPSVALGTNAINPLDMASAYGTFATNGLHHPPVAITRIVDSTTGKTIYEDESKSERVLDPGVSYLTTSALQAVVERGTGVNAQIGRPQAGKTGTAQEWRDAWFVGYTPDMVTSVWVGYPQGEIEMKSSCSGVTSSCLPTRTITSGGVVGGSFPALIWKTYMLRALSGVPASAFSVPNIGLVHVTIDTRTGCLATRFTPSQYQDDATFAKGTEPEASCRTRPPGVKVPDVFSFPVDDAIATLQRAGFSVERRDQPSATYPPGRVIGQEPDGGDKAPEGSTVIIYVSVRENNDATVPDVLGMTQSQAEATIANAGLRSKVIYENESGKGRARKNRGRVWKQSPSSGTQVDRGSTVTIWVNR